MPAGFTSRSTATLLLFAAVRKYDEHQSNNYLRHCAVVMAALGPCARIPYTTNHTPGMFRTRVTLLHLLYHPESCTGNNGMQAARETAPERGLLKFSPERPTP